VTFNFKRLQSSWPFRADGRDFELSVTGNLQVNNGETMRQMALRGAGIARLGQFHVADDIRAGALVPILETYNPGDLELISAVYVGGGQLPQRVRSFIDYLAEYIEKSPIRRP
jgi:DNA-binding transcriptional LysR family regulator